MRLSALRQVCSACADHDLHPWILTDFRLPENGMLALRCDCPRPCRCRETRAVRLLVSTKYASHPPDHSAPPELADLVNLYHAFQFRSQRALTRDAARQSPLFARVRRFDRAALALSLGGASACLALLVWGPSVGWPLNDIGQAAAGVAMLVLLGLAWLLSYSHAPVLSAAVAAHAERYGPLRGAADTSAEADVAADTHRTQAPADLADQGEQRP